MYIKIIELLSAVFLAPLLFGMINRVKALFSGRKGQPLLQLYYDIYKLLRKGSVYSVTTTWIFFAAPIVNLAALFFALACIPFAGHLPLISFQGDLILFIYLLALARFFMLLAALDTGSSFEGMGASREAQFAIFVEPALFLSLAALARITGRLSIADIFSNITIESWQIYGPALFLSLGALFIIFLTENSRIPVDDPNTHLELTMIHEVMVLDHGGVDLAFILYSAAIKFWVLATFIVGIIFKIFSFNGIFSYVFFLCAMILVSLIVGMGESTLARLRLLKVPHFLIIALALSVLALTFTMR